ncbi:Copper amine oxidase N-terminal domain-containing protein [Paenibacillus uliginis N3/975]|uniref:Copper amine oxidase N-terminal domain-containing protein n=1 Tax=Paenibacillus uliginis N3/975 TaxID=1313296 RepID=A0A1X7HK87_9BACL|nr:stalk domain-containing protein [Paenibacillus uliginis]SMF88195.1 Copper amine oxidase N-terminal domain-containing protein [Paenibacillus uliginis N3/975]
MNKKIIKTVATLALGMMIGSATIAAAAPGTIQAVLSKFTFVVDGQKQTLKSDPIVYKGTTYLPVREVAEMLNAEVSSFDNKAKKIELKTKGSQTTSNPQLSSNQSSAPQTPLKLKLNETATKGDMTIKVNSVSYTDFIPSKPGETSGTLAESGHKFAIIQFEATLNAEPTDRFAWGALDFLDHAVIGGKKISSATSYNHNNLFAGETKIIQVSLSLPENLDITSVTFRNPSNKSIFGTIDL